MSFSIPLALTRPIGAVLRTESIEKSEPIGPPSKDVLTIGVRCCPVDPRTHLVGTRESELSADQMYACSSLRDQPPASNVTDREPRLTQEDNMRNERTGLLQG